DEWLRHRLRALQLKHWRRGTTVYRELLALGASESAARKAAGHSRRWWHTSGRALHLVLSTGYFDRLGVPRRS
ncbi:MAG: group II intron reverse transcriptase/maturase, partial [Burkholderia sp.]